MEKIKEKIEILRKGTLNRYKHDTYNECLDIIDQELQDYTFIRVPKKIKLSEIIEKLHKFYVHKTITYFPEYREIHTILGLEVKLSQIKNAILKVETPLNSSTVWLYELLIAGTIIEVDV